MANIRVFFYPNSLSLAKGHLQQRCLVRFLPRLIVDVLAVRVFEVLIDAGATVFVLGLEPATPERPVNGICQVLPYIRWQIRPLR
jgi:hypothetical protein